MNWLHSLFSKLQGWLTSPKAISIETQIANLLPMAVEIVGEIDAIAPSKTLEQFNVIAEKYALPTITAIAADPEAAGNVALNLATKILQKNHAPTAAVYLLNTVVQLAVAFSKTNKA